MPHSHSTVYGPIDTVTPQGYTTFAARIKPDAFYKDKKAITDADYRVPPFTLVFAKIVSPKSKGYDGTRIVHASKKQRRDPEVPDVICNFYNIHEGDRHPGNIRFVGVAYDGIADVRGARNFPDKVGRFSVIASGKVTIMCNKEDLQNIHVGELVEWVPRDNGQVYHGLPSNWSTAKLQKATHKGSGSSIGNTMFGSSKVLDLSPIVYDSKGDIDETQSEGTVVELGRELAVIERHQESTGNHLKSIFDRLCGPEVLQGRNPKRTAAGIATFFFGIMGEENPEDWENKLYNPDSPWWCEEVRPSSEDSTAWYNHCFGYSGHLNMHLNEHRMSFTSPTLANCLCGGRSFGWINRLIIPLISEKSDFKWTWKSAGARKKAVDAANGKHVEAVAGDDVLNEIFRKAYVNGNVTAEDVWELNSGNVADADDSAALKEYTVPFLQGGSMSNVSASVAASCAGMYVHSENKVAPPDYKKIAAYGATKEAFEAKRAEIKERLVSLGIEDVFNTEITGEEMLKFAKKEFEAMNQILEPTPQGRFIATSVLLFPATSFLPFAPTTKTEIDAFFAAGAIHAATEACMPNEREGGVGGGVEEATKSDEQKYNDAYAMSPLTTAVVYTAKVPTGEFMRAFGAWEKGELNAQYGGMNRGSDSRVIGKLIDKNMFSNEVTVLLKI